MGLLKTIKSMFKRDYNPAALSPNKAWAMGLDFLGAPSSSGEVVTPITALSCAAYFAAIRSISEDIGKLPLHVFRVGNDGGRNHIPDHYLQNVLDFPNDEMSAMSFRETMTSHALGWGGGFAEIQRDSTGKPLALWPLSPRDVRIERDPTGELVYRVGLPYGRCVMLAKEDVFHLRGLGYDGITSYCLAFIARDSIGSALAQDRFASSYFQNGASPSGVFVHPNHLSELAHENLRKSLEDRYSRSENAHKVMVLEEGIQYTQISSDPEKSQLLGLRQFSVDEIARLFRIPPHKIGSLNRATFSNIEQQSLEYVCDCLQPWATRWEQEIERKLTSPLRYDVYAKHEFNSLLRGDSAARGLYYQQMLMNGVMSLNEVRRLEELPPIDNGDEHFIPAQWVPLDRAVNPPPPPAPVMALPAPPDRQPTEAPDGTETDDPTDGSQQGQGAQDKNKGAPNPVQLDRSQRASLKLLLMDAISRTLRVERNRIDSGKPDIVDKAQVRQVLGASIRASASMYGRSDADAVLDFFVGLHFVGSHSGKGLDADAWAARSYDEAEAILNRMEST